MTASHGLLLTRDLMFLSKITGTAAAMGLRVETVGTLEQLLSRIVDTPPQAVFLDLNCAEIDPRDVVQSLTNVERCRVIAFGSHVDQSRLETARDAGCTDVLPRSKFSANLPEILKASLGPPS